MTLQQLEYVISLDTHRHFVKASKASYVTQPTLTMQLKKLEGELGYTLFDRSKKPLVPTKQGAVFIAKARNLLREFEQLKNLVHDEVNKVEGEFRLGIIPTLAPYLLPIFLGHFSKEYPITKLVIVELTTENIIDGLLKDQLDLALLVTPLDDKRFRERKLFYEPFWLYAQEHHALHRAKKLTGKNLPAEDMLILSEGHCFREQMLSLCEKPEAGKKFNFSYQSGSVEGLKTLVQKGVGFTLIPELAIRKEDQPFLRKFDEPQPVREVSLVCLNSFGKEKLLEIITDSIQSNLPKHLEQVKHFKRIRWR